MKATKSGGTVFEDIGFDSAAEERAAKADPLALVLKARRGKKLTQKEAAALCGVDQPTLSKALSSRLDSITIDRIAGWLLALGKSVRIDLARKTRGTLSVQAE